MNNPKRPSDLVACVCKKCGKPIKRPACIAPRAKCDDCKRAYRNEWKRTVGKVRRPSRARPGANPFAYRDNLNAWLKNPENIKRRAEAQRRSDAVRTAAIAAARIGKPLALAACAASPLCRPGTENIHAKWWFLRGPDRKIYEFRCLNEFVRRNPDLFEPGDAEWTGKYCRAIKGIGSLRPERLKPLGVWKGWQWIAQNIERRKMGNNDLLGGTAQQANAGTERQTPGN